MNKGRCSCNHFVIMLLPPRVESPHCERPLVAGSRHVGKRPRTDIRSNPRHQFGNLSSCNRTTPAFNINFTGRTPHIATDGYRQWGDYCCDCFEGAARYQLNCLQDDAAKGKIRRIRHPYWCPFLVCLMKAPNLICSLRKGSTSVDLSHKFGTDSIRAVNTEVELQAENRTIIFRTTLKPVDSNRTQDADRLINDNEYRLKTVSLVDSQISERLRRFLEAYLYQAFTG